jgi:hypothetical protein
VSCYKSFLVRQRRPSTNLSHDCLKENPLAGPHRKAPLLQTRRLGQVVLRHDCSRARNDDLCRLIEVIATHHAQLARIVGARFGDKPVAERAAQPPKLNDSRIESMNRNMTKTHTTDVAATRAHQITRREFGRTAPMIANGTFTEFVHFERALCRTLAYRRKLKRPECG